jgi:hypothetical protein
MSQEQPEYHMYAFVTVRQCGAAWEAAASFLEWLAGDDAGSAAATAAGTFTALAAGAKTLLFKLARAAATGRELDTTPAIAELAEVWDDAIGTLAARYT